MGNRHRCRCFALLCHWHSESLALSDGGERSQCRWFSSNDQHICRQLFQFLRSLPTVVEEPRSVAERRRLGKWRRPHRRHVSAGSKIRLSLQLSREFWRFWLPRLRTSCRIDQVWGSPIFLGSNGPDSRRTRRPARRKRHGNGTTSRAGGHERLAPARFATHGGCKRQFRTQSKSQK